MEKKILNEFLGVLAIFLLFYFFERQSLPIVLFQRFFMIFFLLLFLIAQRRLFSTAPESSGGSGGFLFGFVLGGVAVGGYSYMSLTNPSLPKPFFLKSSSESEVKIFDSVTVSQEL